VVGWWQFGSWVQDFDVGCLTFWLLDIGRYYVLRKIRGKQKEKIDTVFF